MDEKKMLLPLDLQFFADDNTGDNPTPTNEASENQPEPKKEEFKEEHKVEEQPKADVEKKFTQADLNKINIKGKQDELKRILKATGFENEEELLKHLEKVKNYDELLQENTSYKAQQVKNGYIKEIANNNVDDEYFEAIYNTLPPTENEKVEDYNVRVKTYLETHQAFLKKASGTSYFNSNYDVVKQTQNSARQPLSIRDALKEKYGL